MAYNIKLPWKLPKTVTRNNQVYEFKSKQLMPPIPYTYPGNPYIQIHYKNKEWGYDIWYSSHGCLWIVEKELGIKEKDFIKYEKKLIKEYWDGMSTKQ